MSNNKREYLKCGYIQEKVLILLLYLGTNNKELEEEVSCINNQRVVLF